MLQELAQPTSVLGEVPLMEHCRASDIIDIISISLCMLGVQNMKYRCESNNMTFLSDACLCRATESSYRIIFTVAILIIFVASEF
jgi:hypothetical protein